MNPAMAAPSVTNALTIDVEDYFQVGAFEQTGGGRAVVPQPMVQHFEQPMGQHVGLEHATVE